MSKTPATAGVLLANVESRVKRDPARYDALALRKKVGRFLEKNPEKSSRQLSLRCLSLEDM